MDNHTLYYLSNFHAQQLQKMAREYSDRKISKSQCVYNMTRFHELHISILNNQDHHTISTYIKIIQNNPSIQELISELEAIIDTSFTNVTNLMNETSVWDNSSLETSLYQSLKYIDEDE